MEFPSTLNWLIDAGSTMPGADSFLPQLSARLIDDGVPLAGAALTMTAPHPIIAKRVWLWRADTGAVIEALGFGALGLEPSSWNNVGRDWLAGLQPFQVHERAAGADPESPVLAWALRQPLTSQQIELLDQTSRFAAAPLAALVTRATLAALLETYLGKRSAAQVLAGRLKREAGETIRAVLLFADLRGFTELSETQAPEAVIAALDAWFDRIAGSVHAFKGEVLKFIGDGVLAIFPVGGRGAAAACDAALSAAIAARAGMAHLDQARAAGGLPSLPFGMALHLGDVFWGNIGAADRLDFTAIGPAVNLVSRLEGLCRPLNRKVLISSAVAKEITASLIPLGDHALRGIAAPCGVFALLE